MSYTTIIHKFTCTMKWICIQKEECNPFQFLMKKKMARNTNMLIQRAMTNWSFAKYRDEMFKLIDRYFVPSIGELLIWFRKSLNKYRINKSFVSWTECSETCEAWANCKWHVQSQSSCQLLIIISTLSPSTYIYFLLLFQ